jgi:acyl-CoA synthetase (AMP-forming)/AMP-acid ligase II
MINIGELGTKTAGFAPSRAALIAPKVGVTRTFGELDERTNRLARALAGVYDAGLGHRVAALSQNCVELMELYVAAAKAGALLFPLNWRFSPSQVAEALLDAAPTVVFYETVFRSVVDEIRTTVDVQHWVEWSPGRHSEYEELLDKAASTASWLELPDPTSLLHEPYLAISTGGTTGIPKSAVHTQHSYGACVLDYLAAARITAEDTYLMLGQLFHIVGYMALAYLSMGRPVVIADFEAEELLTIIEQERVSGFFAIATMLPRLVNGAHARGIDASSIRQVEYGGAPTAEEVIRDASVVFECDMMQAWGMTEFGPGTYLSPGIHTRALAGYRPELLRSCGTPALFSRLAILDEEGNPVPQDGRSMGEICHRGPNNMVGYWNKPEETANTLRDGWIHTGDGGAWDDDGHVFILDRIKSMIISGGENIFPAEIERALGNHPAVAEVVVVGVPHPEWGEIVKAAVVRHPGVELSADEVREYVGNVLASYKKPRIVEFLEELPVTATGKVNRKLLREAPLPASEL